ncbi:hypothetical protein LCGC14_1905920 [marine sediment metagenome]|uniref:DNA methylase N-4/N-6 domain-containing protein n=1 Tax=marine sediment metagenome TaxID=412755 RepID=A0A0F9I934_9ZZZZ
MSPTRPRLQKPKLVKSVSNSQGEILRWIIQLHCPDGFDLDPTYSKGVFYKDVLEPRFKSDLAPQIDGVEQADCTDLPIQPNSLRSIVFDPPFMFGKHGQTENNIMNKRFTMFDSFADLCVMYQDSLKEFHRILKRKGILVFKCQDYTDSKTTMTHCLVYQWAELFGFYAKDLFILLANGGRIYNPSLRQKHARKFHSYLWVLEKK